MARNGAEGDTDGSTVARGSLTRWPEMRELQRIVVRDLIVHGPQSRVGLARKLSLSRTSLSRLTQELEALGLLGISGTLHSPSRGRPQELLQVRQDAAFFHGVELAHGRIHGVAIDLTATVVADHTEALRSTDPDHVADMIVAMHELLSAQAPPAVALGIGVPGLVTRTDGAANAARVDGFGWDGVPLGTLVGSRVGIPVTVINETVGLTGAHLWFGAARGRTSVVLFAIGPRVEAGIAVFDELMLGGAGLAGRVTHSRLAGAGLPCPSGHDNCVHAFITRNAIAHNAGRPQSEYARVVESARYGEKKAVDAFDTAATALGMIIAEAVNLLNPEMVLVTGEAVDVLDISVDSLHTSLTEHLDSVPVGELDIQRPGFRYSQYAQGAAIAAILGRFGTG